MNENDRQLTLDEILGAVEGLAVEPGALDPSKAGTEADIKYADDAADVVGFAEGGKRALDLADERPVEPAILVLLETGET